MPPIVVKKRNVKKLLHNIKPLSAGSDGIHSVILKNLADKLAYPLSIIFTKSLLTSSLPNDWLHFFVRPIYKGSDSRITPNNYTPIYLTSIACKILEPIIKDNIFND